jgi:uncharacterized membrane protein YcgQ (UPF0703/DUF1980 family)
VLVMMVFVFVLMAAAMALLLLLDPPWFSVQTSVHRMPQPRMDHHLFKTLLIFQTIYVLVLKIDTSGLNHVCVENPNLRYNDCARQNRSDIRVPQNRLLYRYAATTIFAPQKPDALTVGERESQNTTPPFFL